MFDYYQNNSAAAKNITSQNSTTHSLNVNIFKQLGSHFDVKSVITPIKLRQTKSVQPEYITSRHRYSTPVVPEAQNSQDPSDRSACPQDINRNKNFTSTSTVTHHNRKSKLKGHKSFILDHKKICSVNCRPHKSKEQRHKSEIYLNDLDYGFQVQINPNRDHQDLQINNNNNNHNNPKQQHKLNNIHTLSHPAYNIFCQRFSVDSINNNHPHISTEQELKNLKQQHLANRNQINLVEENEIFRDQVKSPEPHKSERATREIENIKQIQQNINFKGISEKLFDEDLIYLNSNVDFNQKNLATGQNNIIRPTQLDQGAKGKPGNVKNNIIHVVENHNINKNHTTIANNQKNVIRQGDTQQHKIINTTSFQQSNVNKNKTQEKNTNRQQYNTLYLEDAFVQKQDINSKLTQSDQLNNNKSNALNHVNSDIKSSHFYSDTHANLKSFKKSKLQERSRLE